MKAAGRIIINCFIWINSVSTLILSFLKGRIFQIIKTFWKIHLKVKISANLKAGMKLPQLTKVQGMTN